MRQCRSWQLAFELFVQSAFLRRFIIVSNNVVSKLSEKNVLFQYFVAPCLRRRGVSPRGLLPVVGFGASPRRLAVWQGLLGAAILVEGRSQLDWTEQKESIARMTILEDWRDGWIT